MNGGKETGDSEPENKLQTITSGASIYAVGKITSYALGFAFTVILTRSLSTNFYGIFVYVTSIISIFQVLSRLGTGESLLRFLPERIDDSDSTNWVATVAYFTAFISSVIFSGVLFVAAPLIASVTLNDPLMVDILRIFAVILPVRSLLNLTTSVFRATEKINLQILIKNIFEPGIKVIITGSAILLGFSLIGIVAAIAIGSALTLFAAISVLYIKTTVRPFGKRTEGNIKSFFNFSLPLTLRDLGQTLYNRFDILMVGFFLSGSIVGIYRVSILVTTVLTLPLMGINQLFPPIASKLYADDHIDKLSSIYKTLTRWVFMTVLVPMMALIIYSTELLRIFGKEFTTGGLILSFFAIAQLFNVSVGPSGYLLTMTNNQYYNTVNQWLLGLINIILNYMFILNYGAVGAAAATAATLAFINLLRLFEIWKLEGLHPYSVRYWKPIVAGIGSGGVMAAFHAVMDGYMLIISGGITGGIVFVVILLILGVEDRDRQFIEKNVIQRI